MWRNVKAAALNATFQLLVIYRLEINIHFDIYIYIYIIDYFSKGYFDTD